MRLKPDENVSWHQIAVYETVVVEASYFARQSRYNFTLFAERNTAHGGIISLAQEIRQGTARHRQSQQKGAPQYITVSLITRGYGNGGIESVCGKTFAHAK